MRRAAENCFFPVNGNDSSLSVPLNNERPLPYPRISAPSASTVALLP